MKKQNLVVLALNLAMLSACGSHGGSGGATPPGLSPVSTSGTPGQPTTANPNKLLRISSVNGEYNINHSAQIDVEPGDVINLSSDVFDVNNNYQAESLPAEDFIWSANDANSDTCAPSDPTNCETASHFEVSDYGVSYYTPNNMQEFVVVVVKTADNSGLLDKIILHNSNYSSVTQTPAAPFVVADPTQYPYSTFSNNLALAGMGRWIFVNGARYFAPYTYVNLGESEWMPYRNGYWAWDNTLGWTWISYDPWGFVTDHYGYWRHHADYGWVWAPFEDNHYEPYAVTWINDGPNVGWFPYYEAAPYNVGIENGFDDQYQQGLLLISRAYSIDRAHTHAGFTIVNQTNITNVNIALVVENRTDINDSLTLSVVRNSFAASRQSKIPGGSLAASREFLEAHATGPAVETTTKEIVSPGGARFMLANQSVARPAAQQAVVAKMKSGKTLPVGSVVKLDASAKAKVALPSKNNKVIVPAPIIRNKAGQPTQVLAKQTKKPAQAEDTNPIAVGSSKKEASTVPEVTKPVPEEKPKATPKAHRKSTKGATDEKTTSR